MTLDKLRKAQLLHDQILHHKDALGNGDDLRVCTFLTDEQALQLDKQARAWLEQNLARLEDEFADL